MFYPLNKATHVTNKPLAGRLTYSLIIMFRFFLGVLENLNFTKLVYSDAPETGTNIMFSVLTI